MPKINPMDESLFARIVGELKREYGELFMLIGDTGCCGYSNVFLTNLEPDSSYDYIGEDKGVKIYVHRFFKEKIQQEDIRIEVVETICDDSFSLETTRGFRFVLKTAPIFSHSDASYI